MIIKKYVCKRFAGIKNKDIDFQDGLNVVLGSNEAGKSTLIEGIHAILFKQSKLGFRSNEDKYFREKFMPIPSGDSIDGEVIICNIDGDYKLSKEWGTEPSSQLILPTYDTIKNEDRIQELLKDILMFGEGTYSSIFFSKQVHLKEAIENIIGNKEATSEISFILRRAIMELDGVSLDKLCKKIDDEIESLYKRWDIEKSFPENNRGISNPYKVGFGQIVDSFYKKEAIRLEMDRANEAEKQYNEICIHLKNVETKLVELKSKKDFMEKLENDVIQRSIIEPQIGQFNAEMATLSKINQEWPQNEMRLKQVEVELINIEDNYKRLEEEKELAKKVVEKHALAMNLKKIDDINTTLNDLHNQITSIKNVTKSDIEELEINYNNMLKTEAMLKAGVIIGQLNYYNGNTDIIITKDLDTPNKITLGEAFYADGYIKLEVENLFEIEFKSGDMDFKELRLKYEGFKSKYNLILENLEIISIEEAKLEKERLDKLNRSIETYNSQMEDLLGGYSYEALKEKIDAFGDLSQVRGLELIESEMKKIDSKKIEVISDKKLLDSNIQKWTEDYINIDGLFDKIITIKMSQKNIKDQLVKLAPIPEEYESTDNFRKVLSQIRIDYETSQESLSSLREIYFERERDLPNSTYEELSIEYETEENIFNKKLEKGKKLLRIKETYEATRLKMDEASFTPVIQAFSNYIDLLTNGNYNTSDIDNDFNVRLEKKNQISMPLNLLSSGTYDSVALALRLSILEYILGENKGFLILDDCLVDLDPYRKDMAAKLINEFANKHQVIFTTCSPDTALLLGGYLIEM